MPTRANKKANTSNSPSKKTETAEDADKVEKIEKGEKNEKSEKPEKPEEETKSGHKRQREASSDKVFYVEAILDKKRFYGVWRYKVKWQGFSEEECTWEPAKNLGSVKEMMAEFNKTFVPKEEDEEEKTTKPTPKEKPTKTKSTSKKNKEEDTEKAKKFEKKEKKTSIGDPKKKVKTEKPEEVTKVDCGHFKLGDHPNQITNAKQEHNRVLFTIQWKPREDGTLPSNTKMSNEELRKYDKDLLLDFYEARLKFVKPISKDSAVKSANKAMEEEKENKKKSESSDEASEANENGVMETEKPKEGNKNKKNKKQDIIEEEKESDSDSEENKKENQLVQTVPGEKEHTKEDLEHDIDDNDQPIYADISFNVAEDMRPETYAPPTRIVNTQPDFEKEVLNLESPQEISDEQSDKNGNSS